MSDDLHVRETDLELSGIAGTMRFLDSPDVRFVLTFSVTCTVSDPR